MNESFDRQRFFYPTLTAAAQQRLGKGTREAAAAVTVAISLANQ